MLLSFAIAVASVFATAADTGVKDRDNDAAESSLTAAGAFADLPGLAIELLPRSTRLDMLDYYAADSIYSAPNAMEGLSRLRSVTPDFLEVELTSVSTLQIKILPDRKHGQMVMTIYTIGGEKGGADSEVRFYDQNLNELESRRYLKLPELKDYFDIPKGSATDMKEIREMLPFYTTVFSASPGSDLLESRLTIGDYVDMYDYNILKLFMKQDVSYRWTGSGFKLNK